jgi:hypothetical protein
VSPSSTAAVLRLITQRRNLHCAAGFVAVYAEIAGGREPIALAYVYFEDEPSRRGLVNRLSGADAKAVAQTIARALTACGSSA